jgi:diamine N-acetyltransferase
MPTLRGERVILRPIERDDLERLAELGRDLETAHRRNDSPPLPRPLAEHIGWHEAEASEPPTNAAWFAIEVGGVVIGDGGLHEIDHYHGRAELGIGLGRDYWGQGYGQDAVRTLLEYAFRQLNLRKVSLEVLADDARAVGAYRKAGFQEEGRLREHTWFEGAYHDSLWMAAFRDRWPSPPESGA